MLAGFCIAYIFMQAFAVPGTLSLSLLAGALFGATRGLLLVAGAHPTGSVLHALRHYWGCLPFWVSHSAW